MTRTRRELWRIDVLIAVCLGVGYAALLLATVHDLGYARDEGFYFAAARSYEAWFELLFRAPSQAFDRAVIDRSWAHNHEHPAFVKSLFALSRRYLYGELGWFREEGTAYRFPAIALSGVALAVTYGWSAKVMSRTAAVVAALLFAMMPRIFYHSHLACFDMPVATMWLVTSYAYFRSSLQQGVRGAVLTGVLYGLLLNTKHNSWLLPPALALHWALLNAVRWRQGFGALTRSLPKAFLAIAVLGPLVFFATWPWIWHDTVARLREYAAFHLGHEYYNMEFLGRTYWKPPMPRLYAPVMTIATVPFVTLALFASGLVLAGRHAAGQLRGPQPDTGIQGSASSAAASHFASSPRVSAYLLWGICIASSYAPWLSSSTPIFGGTKHWITAYPFLAMFAGVGFDAMRVRVAALVGERARAVRLAAVTALAASVVVGPTVMTLHAHPWQLSAYTPIVGGAAGAATLGLNRTFWGYTTGAVAGVVNDRAPAAGHVFVHDTAMQSFQMLQSDGRLRADLRPSWFVHGSQLALYHHEPHMAKVEHQIWVDYGTAQPAHVGTFDGVPVVWLYQRPALMTPRR
jgi:4-amino-4-deoxy-L-arabinose transferase-like glycosyltransferase